MSEKHDLEWALELAIAVMEDPDLNWDRKKLLRAAKMLKNGGPIIKKSDRAIVEKCDICGNIFSIFSGNICYVCGNNFDSCKFTQIIALKSWTERKKLQIFTERSGPTFKEIE